MIRQTEENNKKHMNYKPTYTQEEVEEVVKWFETHRFEQDLDLGHGIHIRSLDTALHQFIHVARTQYANRTFSGQIQMLFNIRDELIRQDKVIGEK